MSDPAQRHSAVDVLFVAVSGLGWLAQSLAFAGQLTLAALGLAFAVTGFALFLALGGPPAVPAWLRRLSRGGQGRPWPSLASAVIVLLLASLLYLPPVPLPLDENGATVATFALGTRLARTGELPAAGGDPLAADGRQANRMAAGDGLFFPAWVAMVHLVAGLRWSGVVPALFAALSLLAAYRLGRRLTGSALFGGAFLVTLGFNYPQAWLARTSVPESAAQFLVLAAAAIFAGPGPGVRPALAAGTCFGPALLCSPNVLPLVLPGLVLMIALGALGGTRDRRRAAAFCLATLPFLVQARLQSALLGHPAHPWFPWGHGGGGPVHWLTWYVTLPFLVLAAGGLAELLLAPKKGLRLVRDAGPLFPLAFCSLAPLIDVPQPPPLQPAACRPFTIALIPAVLLLALLFLYRMHGRLAHPLPRLAVAVALALPLGLTLANLMPMATGKPGIDAADFLRRTAAPLIGPGRPFTALLESEPAGLGLHMALEGAFGIDSRVIDGNTEQALFEAMVHAPARKTALVIGEGLFTPHPALVRLRPLADVVGSLRLLPPATDHLPSSTIDRPLRLQLFEALPVKSEADNPLATAPSGPLRVRVGRYAEDWPWIAEGFRPLDRIGGRPFRWTGARARLRLPSWAASVTLELGGFRPPGAPSAAVSVVFPGGEPLACRELPRSGVTSLEVLLPATTGGGTRPDLLELRAAAFRPGPWFDGPNDEALGVQLFGLVFRQAP